MNMVEARAILGVDGAASESQLRAAYRNALKLWHPDRFASDPASHPEAVRRTQRINAAYRMLVQGAVGQGRTTEFPQPVRAASKWGRPIDVVDSKWWPLRILTSETTSAWKGVLVFAVVWAVLVGLGLAVEALLR